MNVSNDNFNTKRCLNCGAEVSGRYCRECGQRTDTGRITMRSLGVHLLSNITRVSGALLRTSWLLLRHPWEVVRAYIRGRRTGLVSPVTLLLLYALYWGAATAIMDKRNSVEIENAMLSAVYNSITVQYLYLALPVAAGTWLVYRRDIRGRYNFAELLVAALYLACTFLLVDFILAPVEYFSMTVAVAVLAAATVYYCIMSLVKAFPQPTGWRTAGKILLWMAVTGVLLVVCLLAFSVPLFWKTLDTIGAQ